MASLNKVQLIGNLGADPESRALPSGDAISTLRLATTDRYKDKHSGEFKESTEWHRVVFFGRLAEIANQYLRKGSAVYVEGRIRTRKWQDQSGQDRYSTEIIGEQMQMLGGRGGAGGGDSEEGAHAARESSERRSGGSSNYGASRSTPTGGNVARSSAPSGGFDDIDDDIPF